MLPHQANHKSSYPDPQTNPLMIANETTFLPAHTGLQSPKIASFTQKNIL
jgi:hypothetical protein